MKQAIVRAERIGTGTRADPFRAAMSDYVVEIPGRTGYWEWINPMTESRFVFVKGNDADVDNAVADARITPLSPVFTTDRALVEWTETLVKDSPAIARSIVEQDRLPVDWVGDNITWQQFLTFSSSWHMSMQFMRRFDPATFAALNKTLDTQLTARELNEVRRWTTLVDHGFDTPRRLSQDVARQPWWSLLTLGPFDVWRKRRAASGKPIQIRGNRLRRF